MESIADRTVQLTLDRDAYSYAWITALQVEFTAAKAMLDVIHERPSFRNDPNSYAAGSINGHNIIVVKSAHSGVAPTCSCATHLRRSFRNIRFFLCVGIGGGLPSKAHDIRLGDVVVSKPLDNHPGVVNYDTGKVHDDKFEAIGSINRPPDELLNAVDHMAAEMEDGSREFFDILRSFDQSRPGFASRDRLKDKLFASSDPNSEIEREPRPSNEPHIHRGLIASGGLVIKTSGQWRDELLRRFKSQALLFEMEAAGLMNVMPTLVIRGVSDYCDSHKNDDWHRYAAASAAAYAKWLLRFLPSDCTPDTLDDTQVPCMPLRRAATTGLDTLDLRRRQIMRPGDVDSTTSIRGNNCFKRLKRSKSFQEPSTRISKSVDRRVSKPRKSLKTPSGRIQPAK